MKPATDIGFNMARNALIELGAKSIGSAIGPNGSGLTWHTLNGKVIIFQAYANNEGFEVYAPVYDGLSVQETIDAMRRYLTTRGAAVKMQEPAQPACEQCGEVFSMDHDCTAGDHHYTAHSGRDDEGMI